MKQSPKSKGFSYYLKLDLSTLQGKITAGFCTLGLIAVILVGIASHLLKPALEKSQYINGVIYPSHLQSLSLDHQLSSCIALFKDTHLRQSSSLHEEDISKEFGLIKQTLDSLNTLSASWLLHEDRLNLQLAQNKINELLDRLRLVNKTGDQVQVYEKDVPLLYHEAQTALSKIILNQATLQKDYQAFISERTQSFLSTIIICFLVALVAGIGIGSFIVVRVLALIRKLKYSILELSEGRLIEPIPPSRNELNSIGRAINVLSDNLRDIKVFASEVGKGSFDNNISVFGNAGELGQALAGMRESLKKVSEEEKIRAWTAEGLASFNEYLRTATDDADAFARELVSRLVKQLGLNQGALYVLREEGTDQVLDLKACYAFDRQKFISKTIEPGQGFVGQVFLEKEYIYLKDIPANFVTISSGLGEARPRYLLVMPLKVNQDVNGVLELAAFSALPDYKILFLEKISESISAALAAASNNLVTNQLLEEARHMAKMMKIQEEELRQNSEELMATQEKLAKEIAEVKQDLHFAESILAVSAEPTIIITPEYRISWLNPAAEQLLGQELSILKDIYLSEVLDEPAMDSLQMQQNNNGASPAGAPGNIEIREQLFHCSMRNFSANGKSYLLLTFQKIVRPASAIQ